MALVNDLASQSTTQDAPLQGLGQNVTQGLDAGLAFAAAQQKSDLMGQQLDDMKKNQAMKQNDYILDAFDKASKAKSPQIRKLILDSTNKTQQSWGKPPFNEDTMKMIASDQGAKSMGTILGSLSAQSSSREIGDASDQLVAAGYATPQEAIGLAQKIHEGLSISQNREAAQGYKDKNLDIKEKDIAAREAQLNGRQDTTDTRAAKTILGDVNTRKEVSKLSAATSGDALIKAIGDGKVVDSGNIRRQLSNIIVSTEMGGPGSVADRQAAGVDNLYTKAKELMGKISSQPTSTIPPAYIDQFKHEIGALKENAANNYFNLTEASLAGADGAVLDKATRTRNKYLNQIGYDAKDGQLVPLNSQHSAKDIAGAKNVVANAPVYLQPNQISGLVQKASQSGKSFTDAQQAAKQKGYTLTPEQWKTAGGQ